VRIVLHKSLVVDVLSRNVYISGADALKYCQDFLDVSFAIVLSPLTTLAARAAMALRL
jgi:hypothetical protein